MNSFLFFLSVSSCFEEKFPRSEWLEKLYLVRGKRGKSVGELAGNKC